MGTGTLIVRAMTRDRAGASLPGPGTWEPPIVEVRIRGCVMDGQSDGTARVESHLTHRDMATAQHAVRAPFMVGQIRSKY
jgi:hypothetical protein